MVFTYTDRHLCADHLNSAISSRLWTSSFYNSLRSLSSSSIFSRSEICLELMSSLMICTLEKYSLLRSSRLSSYYFFSASSFFLISMPSCFFLNSSCFLDISACFSVIYLFSATSSSMFAFSTCWISFSRLSISASKSLMSVFIFSMFCSLNRNCSFRSCSCFLRCCFRKQKSHTRSSFMRFREHSPHAEPPQIRLT